MEIDRAGSMLQFIVAVDLTFTSHIPTRVFAKKGKNYTATAGLELCVFHLIALSLANARCN